ncbi:hypothetical protein AB0K18_47915 [Nonomuraea sp. NPDC049421]|uniref:hypothetical protein n=1 Tax=Nonomuraea sp. NPDC049421 TaxID=3155275 RepID=UPI00341ABEDC
MAYDAVPAYRDRLAAGGPLLDLGSGIGGALLTTLTMFPELRAVGVERAEDVVKELRERAEAAAVTSRLEIRCADSRGVPPVRTAEELTAELRDGGFEDVQVTTTPIGRLVLGRRVLD